MPDDVIKAMDPSRTAVAVPTEILDRLQEICSDDRALNFQTLRQVVRLALEIASEGREGRKVGTMFVISDHETVLRHSSCLILDPLWRHPESLKQVNDENMRETAKELAQLDGAFVVSNEGVILSACRYINASSDGVHLPLGLGSRHMAAASITKETNAIAIVISESSVVRIFDKGEIVAVLNS